MRRLSSAKSVVIAVSIKHFEIDLQKNVTDPPAYDGLDQQNQQIECEANNCNNDLWVPWDCDTNCAADYTTCLLGCSGDPVCQSSCLREFDQCLEKC